MARFHESASGDMVPCDATKRDCPRGGAFHTDAEDIASANLNREIHLKEQNGSPLVKKDPYAGKTMVSSATGAEFAIGEKFTQAGEEYYKATDADGNEVTLAANNMGRFEEKAQPVAETPLEEARRELKEENQRIDALEAEIKTLNPEKDAERIADLQAEIDESDWGHLDRKVARLEEAEKMLQAQESNPREKLAQEEHERSKVAETPLEEARRERAEEVERLEALKAEIESLDPKKDAERIAELQADYDESDWGHLDRKVARLEEAERKFRIQETDPHKIFAEHENKPRSFTISHDQDIADMAKRREADFSAKAHSTEQEIKETKAEIKSLMSDIEDVYPNQITAARTNGDKEAFDKAQSNMQNAQMELQQQRSRLGILNRDKASLKEDYQEMSRLRKRYNDTRNPVMESTTEARDKHDELTRQYEHIRATVDDGAPIPKEQVELADKLRASRKEISSIAERNAQKEHLADMAKWRYEQNLKGEGKLSEIELAQAELDYTNSKLQASLEEERKGMKLGREYEEISTKRALARESEVWDSQGNVKNRAAWQELKSQEASTNIDAGENWRNYYETLGRTKHYGNATVDAENRLRALKSEQSNLEKAVKANHDSLVQKSKVEDGGSYSLSAINADRDASKALDDYTESAVRAESMRMDYAVNRDGIDKKTYLEKTIKGLEGEFDKVSADYDKHEARVDRIIEAEDKNYDDQGEIIDRARAQRARDKIAQIRSENAENSARFNGLEKRLSFLRNELNKLAK